MGSSFSFQPKARLLLQLGDQLIRNESVALLELIKNAYDAYASYVNIKMTKIDDPVNGAIIIEDDGEGMNFEIIEKVWMQPGSNYKQKIVDSIKRRTRGERIPIGEKGIGRFGVHKLGNHIELISKTENNKEIHLNINWTDFEKDTTLDKIKVVLDERPTPKHFVNGKSGTLIKITNLKKKWTRATIRELYRSAISLNSPFQTISSFKVNFKLDNQDWLQGLIRFHDIKEYALYFAEAEIKGCVIAKLHYKFKPWNEMVKLEGRKKILKNIRMVEEIKDEKTKKKKLVDINLGKHKIGPINIKLLIFDREPKILNLGVSDKVGFKEYLDINGGVRVFRDEVRILNYGEKDNDWLNLDIKRVNRPGETISNNLIIGAVNLDRIKSRDLKEKTNREGFIEDEAYETFQKSINFFLDKVLTERNIDKSKVRKLYDATSTSEPVIGKLKLLKEKITASIAPSPDREEILKTIRGIDKDYKTIINIYTRSSAAGLSLSIVIHEVEKIINELIKAIDKLPTNKYLKDLIKTLYKTVNDYAAIIRQSSKGKEDLIELINRAISGIQYRIKAHKISFIASYKEKTNINTTVKCAANLFISSIINLIDNSIWWMNYANRSDKKILIDIVDDYDGYLSVLVADNGPGFSIPPEEAIRPFVSDKPDGMGLGLHLADTMMTGLNGKLIFPQEFDLEIPKEFQKGAKVILAFKI